MNEELLAAVQNGQDWLEQFTRHDYAGAFQAYTRRFAPAYAAAVRAAGGEDEAALSTLAEGLLDGLEAGWKRQRVWNRTTARINDKQMLVEYLSPMLLGLEEPGCPRLGPLGRPLAKGRLSGRVLRQADGRLPLYAPGF